MRRLALALALTALAGCNDRAAPTTTTGASAPRLVTLAPHLAELVFAAGAGDYLVGVSAYSDHPAAAAALPEVSDGFRIDAEALLALRPTHVLAWGGGGQAASRALLERLDVTVVVVPSARLADIGVALRQIGALAGTATHAERAAEAFERRIEALTYEGARLTVFYQIGSSPLYTVNGKHFVSELIDRCGGDNIFAALETLAPVVSVEAVVQRDPDVILRPGDGGAPALWADFADMRAVRAGSIYNLPGDLVSRPSQRLAAGGEAICAQLAAARRARQQGS